MSWELRAIRNWPHLREIAAIADEHATRAEKSVLFRGQANDAWRLTPSLNRCLPAGASINQTLALEAVLLERFEERFVRCAPELSRPEAGQLFSWWALMQHYRAPTRLIDWSTSIYVAAYFASLSEWDKNGAIWVLSPWVLLEDAKLRVDHETRLDSIAQQADSPRVVVPLPSNGATDRMSAQEGHFTCCLNVGADQADAIDDMFSRSEIPSSDQFHWKLVVPAKQKVDLLLHLEEHGISSETMFPGLDGLGQSLTDLAKCAAYRQPPRK